MSTPRLLVVGGVSLDTLYLPDRTEPVHTPGGAGLYTALAAASAGGRVRLFAQVPEPMPDSLSPVRDRVDWSGPVIPLDQLPRLEIEHFGAGRAELRSASWGAQLELDPDDLPPDLSLFQTAHVTALGPTEKQLAFVRALRARGVRRISAGTYGRAVYDDGETVRRLLGAVDLFFMNENEALGLFGDLESVQVRTGQLVFVTRGAGGALCVASDERITAAAPPAEELDPTGAGDSFCGAVLARMAAGDGLAEAMEVGCRVAAGMIAGIGPSVLLC